MNNTVEKLKNIAGKFGPDIQALADVVLNDPRFETWTGSGHPKVHHYGDGQLAQHTLEVVELSMNSNEYFKSIGKGVNDSELFLAALYHDIGKIYDYEKKTLVSYGTEVKEEIVWASTVDKNRIYHITQSAIIWSKAFDLHGTKLSKYLHDRVLHGILAHHGRLEYKSPVTPQTRLAWILHCSDMMSARVDEGDFYKDYK